MVKIARIGAVALLASPTLLAHSTLLASPATQARVDRHEAPEARVSAPLLFALVAPLRRHGPRGGVVFAWTMPLFDRRLSQAEKAAALAPELTDAILRVEPIYDPTGLEGPGTAPTLTISAGTAVMDSVFGDRWRVADPDANVSRVTTTLALVWRNGGALPCEAFTKKRLVGPDEVVATALTGDECAVLLATQARGFAWDAPTPIAVAPATSVPVFAAPLPGSRMSSADFWAAQGARVAAIQNRLPGSWPNGTKPAGKAQAGKERVRERGAGNARPHAIGRAVAKLGAKQEPVAAAADP